MSSIDDVHAGLESRAPHVRDPADFEQHASVALVLAPSDVPEVNDLDLLFIRRRYDPRDFWSGHTAFPGGRRDGSDADARAAAVRETFEEVGVDLSHARPLGRLDDLVGKQSSLVVSGFVYGMDRQPPVRSNHEVDAARFMSLTDVVSPVHHTVSGFEYLGQTLQLPAIQVFEPPSLPLWGLSYRFLELLMSALERPIPPMPWDEEL